MNHYDVINAVFEVFGAVFTWTNYAKLRKDREVKGVYWPVTAFFAVWGLWNLIYYPSVGHYWSAAAGVVLCLGNVMWVGLAVKLLRGSKS